MVSFLKIRNVGSNRYLTDKFIFIPVYVPGTKDNISVLIYFKREFYIIDELRTNILINNNTIGPKLINIRILNRLAYIGSYNITY